MTRRMRAGLLQQSAAQGSSGECAAPGIPTAAFATAGVGTATSETGALAGAVAAGRVALRSPLRTRSAGGGSALLPADKASRRSIEAARPEIAPDPRASFGVVAVAAGCGAAGDDAKTDVAGLTLGLVAGGKEALRSPFRTRSAAGGNAAFPADSASRRSIEAARPEMAPDPSVWVAGEAAMKCSPGWVSVRRRETR
jgi:hypothetical protein